MDLPGVLIFGMLCIFQLTLTLHYADDSPDYFFAVSLLINNASLHGSPSEMVKVGKVMDILKKEHPELHKKVQPIFVSIDPARDSLKALRDYAKDFHPSYIFLTGAPQQVQAMAKKYRVYMSKADETEDGDYLVDHSIVIYFHDETGDIADCFTQSMRPSDVVDKVVERMTFVPKY